MESRETNDARRSTDIHPSASTREAGTIKMPPKEGKEGKEEVEEVFA